MRTGSVDNRGNQKDGSSASMILVWSTCKGVRKKRNVISAWMILKTLIALGLLELFLFLRESKRTVGSAGIDNPGNFSSQTKTACYVAHGGDLETIELVESDSN